MVDKKDQYQKYIEEISEEITETVKSLGCQPILFVGSGLSKRYMNTPNWEELLSFLADNCPAIDKGLGYYKQTYKTAPAIGQAFASHYQKWAWEDQNLFPQELYEDETDEQSYIKYTICEYLKSITPKTVKDLGTPELKKEIKSLINIKPHAIITTNYDCMTELLFPEHEPIVGQQILRSQSFSVGEIYKIHGSVDPFNSIVFTQSDYDIFIKKKKFLTAKLLTFFNEHPLLFIGYSASDPNIKAILSDIDEALPVSGDVIPNVYILDWNPDLDIAKTPPREKIIATEEGRSIRVKLIESSDFTWVFEAFAANPALNNVNPKTLRALLARSYHLVRHDIPSMTVKADFQMLEEGVKSPDSFGKLFGIANISDYSAAAAQHPLTATQITKMLGGNGSYLAVKALKIIKEEKQVDVKASDNRYHRAEKVNKSTFHKYSKDIVPILKAALEAQPYEIDLK